MCKWIISAVIYLVIYLSIYYYLRFGDSWTYMYIEYELWIFGCILHLSIQMWNCELDCLSTFYNDQFISEIGWLVVFLQWSDSYLSFGYFHVFHNDQFRSWAWWIACVLQRSIHISALDMTMCKDLLLLEMVIFLYLGLVCFKW